MVLVQIAQTMPQLALSYNLSGFWQKCGISSKTLFLDLISDNSIGGKNIMNYIVVAHTYVFAFLYAICRLGAILSTNKMHTFMCYFCTWTKIKFLILLQCIYKTRNLFPLWKVEQNKKYMGFLLFFSDFPLSVYL